jgi:hypothetical protein
MMQMLPPLRLMPLLLCALVVDAAPSNIKRHLWASSRENVLSSRCPRVHYLGILNKQSGQILAAWPDQHTATERTRQKKCFQTRPMRRVSESSL